MFDGTCPWGARVRAYRSRDVFTTVCSEPWQVAGYWHLRTSIFVDEQRLFSRSDRDANDARSLPIVSLSMQGGMLDQVIGIVRVYPGEDAVWYGGRLGVCKEYRRHGVVGERLIKVAVGTARALGCQRFLATVQAANVRYFERHRFDVQRAIEVCGRPHSLMEARLADFEPVSLPAAFNSSGVAA